MAVLEGEKRIGDLDLNLPDPVLPEADPAEDGPDPLVSSDMPLKDAIDTLRERKNYSNGGAQ